MQIPPDLSTGLHETKSKPVPHKNPEIFSTFACSEKVLSEYSPKKEQPFGTNRRLLLLLHVERKCGTVMEYVSGSNLAEVGHYQYDFEQTNGRVMMIIMMCVCK